MRLSCNGCRVLRKSCSEKCSIRPCLEWIKSPESQANATVFLAKFYGRAGLVNLIDAGPQHLRPAIFRSLLYEACGRIANPIYGSVGLLWSGSWKICQQAVEAVLKSAPIVPISSDSAVAPLKAYDIHHVAKPAAGPLVDLHKVNRSSKFKRSRAKPRPVAPAETTTSHESELSHGCADGAEAVLEIESPVSESASMESGSDVSHGEPSRGEESELELTLGFQPARSTAEAWRGGSRVLANEKSRVDLGLHLSVT